MTDSSVVLIDGPWQHQFVPANGARFHVAELTPPDDPAAPLVVLLHGFPQMWWAWRAQLPALAAGGYRVVAMDLRGCGASDKPPQGYDTPTLARDVAGVIRSLGAHEAVVVGHGLGGVLAWSMPTLQPAVTRAVAVLSAAHPSRLHTTAAARTVIGRPSALRLLLAQLPWLPERGLTHRDAAHRMLVEWGRPGWLHPDVSATYRAAMRVPFAAHSALEHVRWLVRSTPRVDGQRYLAAVRAPVEVPVLHLHGALDRCLPPRAAMGGDRTGRGAPYTPQLIPDAGHFLPEEAPSQVTEALLAWLATL